MNKKTLFFLLILGVPIINATTCALADQPYMGAYFDQNVGTTLNVLFECAFPLTDGTDFDTGNWVGGVISVAGGDGTTPTAYVYQNGFALDDDDDVYWAPMYFFEGSYQDGASQSVVGDSGYIFFFGRIDYDSGNDRIYYRAYMYETAYDVEHDSCSVEEWEHEIPSGEENFIYGRETVVSTQIMYLQVGMEGNNVIDECSWMVRNGHMSAYISSQWYHYAGRSVRGNVAYVTHDGSSAYAVGGQRYTNADVYGSGAATVTWEDGTEEPNDTSLWTHVGVTLETVSTPFD